MVYSPSVALHSAHLREVLRRLQSAGFTLNPEKVVLGVSEINYLGHQISARGVTVLTDRVQAINQYPRPNNLRSLRRFLGMVGFYARFIPGFSELADALHALKRKEVSFVWAEEHAAAFEKLKQALCQAPVLQIPDFDKEFILATDASDVAISAVLQQRIDGALAPISYHGRILTPLERKYSTYEKEWILSFSAARRVALTSSIKSSSCNATTWRSVGS